MRPMRISIREQLALLVLFCCLVCVAVISVAVWVTNLNFVTGISSTSLSLTASLYAQQLASSLVLVVSSVQSISTRVLIQNALIRYNQGNNTAANWLRAQQDVSGALLGGGSSEFLLQAQILPNNQTGLNGPYAVLNETNTDLERIQLPYTANDAPVFLGDETGYPPELYPNLTYHEAPYNETFNVSQASYLGHSLNLTTPLLLGPWQINSSFALCSVTFPIGNNGSSIDILGWMTIVADAMLILDVQRATLGLGNTGVVLIAGPRNRTNLFPPNILYDSPDQFDSQTLGAQNMHYVVSPLANSSRSLRHPDSSFGRNYTFSLSSFPAIMSALTSKQSLVDNAGSYLDTWNEVGDHVSAGYAKLNLDIADWAVIVEQSYDEVVQPITNLRNVLIACLFGTTGVILLFLFPVAHLSVRPIRRLRAATLKTVDPQGYASSSELGGSHDRHDSGDEEQFAEVARKEGLVTRVSGWWPLGRRKRRQNPRPASAERRFRIPGKVQERQHVVHDELTDLSHTFNEMVEELMMQYARLEERVKERTRELELSKMAAEAANESKTLFIANISHELKTPLNGILGMTAVCMHEDDPTKIRRSLGIIYKSGDLLLNLLTDLLTFSKNQIGQHLTLDEKEFRLADISSQILSIFEKQTKEARIHLRMQFEGPGESLDTASGTPAQAGYGPFGTGRVKDMCLWGDQHRILQVLINLVSNSLKFTPPDGSVTVSVRCTGEAGVDNGGSTSRMGSVNSRTSRVSFGPSNAKAIRGRPRGLPGSGSDSSIVSSSERSTGDKNIHTALEINSRESKPLPHALVREQSDSINLVNARTFFFEFEVRDTGPGIPPAQQQKVFEPFVQGDLGLSKKFGGTGLGLSICAQLATLMRGEITLESTEDEGSTFNMRIPLRYVKERADSTASSNRESFVASPKIEPHSPYRSGSDSDLSTSSALAAGPSAKPFESPASKPRLVGLSQPFFATSPPLETPKAQLEALERVAAEASRSGARIRVLVAEDNKVNQEVVLRMLKLEDIYDVTVAKDGQEALDMVRESMDAQNRFDLIFMDIQMPNLDGLQSTRQIRALGFAAPIVALTAFADESNARECIDSGMDYFLPKPIKRPALKQVLKRYCPTIPEEKEDKEPPSPEQKKGKEKENGEVLSPQAGRKEGGKEAEAEEQEMPQSNHVANSDSGTTQASETSETAQTTQPTSPEPISEKPTPLA